MKLNVMFTVAAVYGFVLGLAEGNVTIPYNLSKARDAVTLGFTIYFALHALTSLYGQFTDISQSVHWIMATLQGLIAVGFFMAGRASMSTSVSASRA